MKTLDELFNKPETFRERMEDLWYNISYYYPREGWWAIKTFFRNIKRYWSILWSDNDFDHGFMEELIITKLTLMANYFRTARITEDAEKVYCQINLALQIGRIAFNMNPEENSPENYGGKFGVDYLGHINTRNYKRFWPINDPSIFEGSKGLMFRNDLRMKKAKTIFYKILDRYSQRWWD